jgi:hypothetical protein
MPLHAKSFTSKCEVPVSVQMLHDRLVSSHMRAFQTRLGVFAKSMGYKMANETSSEVSRGCRCLGMRLCNVYTSYNSAPTEVGHVMNSFT